MPVYDIEKLMEETRRIAAEYRQSTGNTLPVSSELAKFDAVRLLNLETPEQPQRAVDALLNTPQGKLKIQVKGRVIFDPNRSGYRVGQLNLDTDWDLLLLVLMNGRYETTEIYRINRQKLLATLAQGRGGKQARGAISVKRFQAVSERCWPIPQ